MLGTMKLLATLFDSDAATGLMERLKNAGIACETQAITEEGGLAATEVLVEESHYEAACDLSYAWFDAEQEAEARQAHRVCPKCRSVHLERVPHDSVEVLFKCQDCGCEILAQT